MNQSNALEMLVEASGIGPDGHPVESKQPRIWTVRRPDEILGMEFDSSDRILGDYIMAKGQPVTILGAGGTGKSRLALQLAASIATGREFIGFETRGQGMKWLILQTENSNRRLKQDLGSLKSWTGKDWPAVAENLLIHTLETDEDGIASLADFDNQATIEALIAEHLPDVIVIDPLGDFGMGDLSKDEDMRNTVRAISRICKKGNPDRAIIILHHSLTGKAGAMKATGYDRASFGRNSKVLQGWTRAQINVTGANPDNNETLVISCGKCSNGKEFAPFAVKLNEGMIYEVDPRFDLEAWQADIGGKPKGPIMTPDGVRSLCVPGMKQAELAKAIQDDCGCCRTASYRYIKQALKAKKIIQSKIDETFMPN